MPLEVLPCLRRQDISMQCANEATLEHNKSIMINLSKYGPADR